MIVVTACFRVETAWIKGSPGLRVVRLPLGASGGLGRVVAEGVPKLVVSTGFCGGLDPTLRTGDLVLATEIRHLNGIIPMDQRLLTRARRALQARGITPAEGGLVTTERVIQSPAEKERLHRRDGALGVEMEAGKLARWAEDRGIGFLAIKAVLDRATRSLPFTGTAGGTVLRHPLAALQAGWAALIAGRAIGRGIGALVPAFSGGRE